MACLAELGWEVYTTYYVPNITLLVIVIPAIVLAAIGIWGRKAVEPA